MTRPLRILAPVKVNLFLEVLARRDDGYHELVTVMDMLEEGDRLVARPADALSVAADRSDVPDGEQNLAFRIVRAAERRLGRGLPAAITIAKSLPPGSGLGAGSSDAAAALRLVLRLHGLELPQAELQAIGAEVGSDVPFFLGTGSALCTGRGERVEPLMIPGRRHYVLVLGGPHISTPDVYARVDLLEPRRDAEPFMEALIAEETDLEHPELPEPFNRLAEAAFLVEPELRAMRDRIASAAGRQPCLSGSGSAFFLLCTDSRDAGETAARVRDVTHLPVRVTAGRVQGDPPRPEFVPAGEDA